MERFNSQICTTREQSEMLLALGLRKETADMYYQKLNDKWTLFVGQPFYYDGLHGTYLIPAWSLHRLILLLDTIACDWIFRNGDCYTNAINGIEWLIKEGYFNKEYLV